MKVYLLTVRHALTRETKIKGVYSSEETANKWFMEYQKNRVRNEKKWRFDDWHLAEIEVDMPLIGD